MPKLNNEPPKYPVRLQVRVPEELDAAIRAEADERGVTYNALVREMLTEYLEKRS